MTKVYETMLLHCTWLFEIRANVLWQSYLHIIEMYCISVGMRYAVGKLALVLISCVTEPLGEMNTISEN